MNFKVGDKVKRLVNHPIETAKNQKDSIFIIKEFHPISNAAIDENGNNHDFNNIKLVDLRDIIKEIVEKETK